MSEPVPIDRSNLRPGTGVSSRNDYARVDFEFSQEEWDILLVARILEGKPVPEIIRGVVSKWIEEAKGWSNYKLALSLRDQHQRQMAALKELPRESDGGS